jgi:hypothetical protein
MSKDWIDTLAKEYGGMHPVGTGATSTREAFARIQAELRSVADSLSNKFSRKFTASHLQTDESVWLFELEAAPGPVTSTRIDFYEYAGKIGTSPSSSALSNVRGGDHEFVLDPKTGSLTENGQIVTESELVRRALDTFLRIALATT